MYEYICLENINKLYTSAGKFDYQQQYKAIIEAKMFSTTEIFTSNIQMSSGTSVTFKKPSAIKPLRLFTEVLDVQNKTYVCQVGTDKSKQNSIREFSVL